MPNFNKEENLESANKDYKRSGSANCVQRWSLTSKNLKQGKKGESTKQGKPILISGQVGSGRRKLVGKFVKKRSGPLHVVQCDEDRYKFGTRSLLGGFSNPGPGQHLRSLGALESAREGVLLLDSVESLPLESQKLLAAVLRRRCFTPLGGKSSIAFKALVVALTTGDPESLLSEGKIHNDLFEHLRDQQISMEKDLGERAD